MDIDEPTAGAATALRRFDDAVTLWTSGDAPAEDVVDAACDVLVAGAGEVALGAVAGVARRHADAELPDLIGDALRERGLPEHRRWSDAAIRATCGVLARLVADGDAEPGRLTAWLLTTTVFLDRWEPAAELVRLAREAEQVHALGLPPRDLDQRVRDAAARLVRDDRLTG